MVSVASVRGYILEEVLAKLIKHAGYDLIAPSAENANLKWSGHGLQVRGRGAWHQVDALGQFRWTPPFNFPIRLFLEAKFRKSRVGIELIRQAIGITSDINQVAGLLERGTATPIPIATYRYSYALASTAGFTREVGALALAHQISLIDLHLPDYRELLERVAELASVAIRMWRAEGGKRVEGRLASLRGELRAKFETEPAGAPEGPPIAGASQEKPSARLLAAQAAFHLSVEALSDAVADVNELFLGTAAGPFFLLLKADNHEDFLRFARKRRRHRVVLRWRGTISAGQIWEISPYEPGSKGYRLTFALPAMIAEWILAQDASARRAARGAKAAFLSRITIYRANANDGDELFDLEYEPQSVEQTHN